MWSVTGGKRAAIGILFLALAVRVVYAIVMPDGPLVQDPALYLGRAAFLLKTGHFPSETMRIVTLVRHGAHQHAVFHAAQGPDAYWPPLYETFLAGLMWLYSLVAHVHSAHSFTPGLIIWLRLVCDVLGTVSVAAVGLIALRLFGRRTALWAMGIAAVFPLLIYIPETLYSEALCIPLLLTSVALTLEYRRTGRHWQLILAAVTLALAALTRVQAVVLLLPLCLAVWPRRRDSQTGRLGVRSFMPIAAVMCSVAVVFAPWTIRNWVEFHHVVPLSLSGGYTLAGVYNAQSAATKEIRWIAPKDDVHMWRDYYGHAGHEWQQNAALQSTALTYAANHPAYVLRVVYWNVRRFLNIQPLAKSEVLPSRGPLIATAIGVAAFWLVAPLWLLGAFARRARSAPLWFWLTPILLVVSVLPVTVDDERFQVTVDPFLIILAAVAIATGLERRPGRRRELRTDDRSGRGSGDRKHRLWRGAGRRLPPARA